MTQPLLNLSAPIWGERSGNTPTITGDRVALDLNLAPAVHGSSPTVALFAAFQVGQPTIAIYRGEMRDAMWVVAIEALTGKVLMAPPIGESAIPIANMMLDPAAVGSTQDMPSLMSSHFGVDLCSVLMMPAQAARYRVFLWLDGLVSPARLIDVPADPQRLASALPSARVPADSIAPAPAASGAAAGITLSLVGGQVRGQWHAPEGSAAAQPLSVMAFSQRDRKPAWATLPATPQGFSVDPRRMLGSPDRAQTAFVCACAGGLLSNVVACPI